MRPNQFIYTLNPFDDKVKIFNSKIARPVDKKALRKAAELFTNRS